jgi:hypothetical protein
MNFLILLGDLNAEVGKEDIFKLIILNETLFKISSGSGVRVVNLVTSKILIVKSMMLPYCNM